MPEFKNDGRALALGEFGGLGLPIENHTWKDPSNWGYETFSSLEELQQAYLALVAQIPGFIERGLSAAIYMKMKSTDL